MGGDAPLLLVLAVLLASAVATTSLAALRRMRRGAAFSFGAVLGVMAAIGVAALVVISTRGPAKFSDLVRDVPLLPPLPDMLRRTLPSGVEPRTALPRASAPQEATLPTVVLPKPRPDPAPGGGQHTGRVTHVRDGDTVVVAGVPIRFANVDCAERGTYAGNQATAAMRRLANGQMLHCELEGRRSYDREVGICRLDDGRDVGGVMVEMGLCHWR